MAVHFQVGGAEFGQFSHSNTSGQGRRVGLAKSNLPFFVEFNLDACRQQIAIVRAPIGDSARGLLPQWEDHIMSWYPTGTLATETPKSAAELTPRSAGLTLPFIGHLFNWCASWNPITSPTSRIRAIL